MDAFIARQPIFNGDQRLFGYELFFRDSMANLMPEIDGDTATSQVLSSSFFTIGIEQLTGGKKASINFSYELIVQEIPLLAFPKKTTIIEILEDVPQDKEVVRICKRMVAQGYQLALDGFRDRFVNEDLLKLAEIIKIDFQTVPADEIHTCLSRLNDRRIRRLAKKIETRNQFQSAIQMGFDLFQGYYFCEPEIIIGKEISSSEMNLLNIILEVNQPEIDFESLQREISNDVALSYKLLRYLNSAYFIRKQKVNTIKEAIIFIGEKEIRRFISLIAMSQLASRKPNELIRTSGVRARFCETVSRAAPEGIRSDRLFTLGLFSLIDTILNQPMAEIMAHLPFSKDLKAALIRREGKLADYLKLVEAYEHGQWVTVSELSRRMGISIDLLPAFYAQACQWGNTLTAT